MQNKTFLSASYVGLSTSVVKPRPSALIYRDTPPSFRSHFADDVGPGGLHGVDRWTHIREGWGGEGRGARARKRVYRNKTGNIMTERFGGDWLPRRPLCRPTEEAHTQPPPWNPCLWGMLWGVRGAGWARTRRYRDALRRGAGARTRIYTGDALYSRPTRTR